MVKPKKPTPRKRAPKRKPTPAVTHSVAALPAALGPETLWPETAQSGVTLPHPPVSRPWARLAAALGRLWDRLTL